MGFIKTLISGIVGFLTGLLKGFKKSEYFLELDDAQATKLPPSPAKNEPAKAEPVKAEPVKAESPQAPVKSESTNGKVSEPVTTVAASTPVAVQAPPEPTPVAKPSPVLTEPAASQTFAPDFLLTPSSNNSRRRPGPSLNYFRDMAKQVKT